MKRRIFFVLLFSVLIFGLGLAGGMIMQMSRNRPDPIRQPVRLLTAEEAVRGLPTLEDYLGQNAAVHYSARRAEVPIRVYQGANSSIFDCDLDRTSSAYDAYMFWQLQQQQQQRREAQEAENWYRINMINSMTSIESSLDQIRLQQERDSLHEAISHHR